MSYLVQARLSSDSVIMQRVTACAATEGVENPQLWAYQHQWQLSAQPGWVDAYKYALDSGDDEPGANEGAITDWMVLSAVQSLLGIEVPDPEPDPEPEAPVEEPDPEPDDLDEPEEEPDLPEEQDPSQ